MTAGEAALRVLAQAGICALWGRYHCFIGVAVFNKRTWRNAYIRICTFGNEARLLTISLLGLGCASIWLKLCELLTGPIKDSFIWTVIYIMYWSVSTIFLMDADEAFWKKVDKLHQIANEQETP
jgi:hypothetical protein